MLGGLRSGQNQALDQPVACIQRCRRVLGRPLISFTVRRQEGSLVADSTDVSRAHLRVARPTYDLEVD
jgi:hypothetical protein